MATKRKAAARPETKSDDNTLTIVGRNDTAGPPDDEFLDNEIIKLSDYLYERKVPTSTVKKNLSKFLVNIGDIVAQAPSAFGAYELHSIEIAAELTVTGELKFWGIGGTEVEGKAGIKFLIRRSGTGALSDTEER
jgi:hypothetical protein